MLRQNVQYRRQLWRVFYELSYNGMADYEIHCIICTQTRNATGWSTVLTTENSRSKTIRSVVFMRHKMHFVSDTVAVPNLLARFPCRISWRQEAAAAAATAPTPSGLTPSRQRLGTTSSIWWELLFTLYLIHQDVYGKVRCRRERVHHKHSSVHTYTYTLCRIHTTFRPNNWSMSPIKILPS